MSRRRAIVALFAGVCATTGCTERLIYEGGICGDGALAPGDACFSADNAASYGVGDLVPLSIRGADFTGDGQVDVLVMGMAPSGAVAGATLLGVGDGTLRAPVDAALQGCSAHPVPGDVDANAASDLLVDDCAPSVSLYLGGAQGVFSGPQSVNVGVTTRSSAVLDVTQDSRSDVLVLGTGPGGRATVSAALQVPGGFSNPDLVPVDVVAGQPFDPTGFVVTDASINPRLVLIDPARVGGLVLAEPANEQLSFLQVDFIPRGLTAADFNGDGIDEVLVTALESETLVTLQLGAAGDPATVLAQTPSGVTPLAQQVVDVDNDGQLDVVMSQTGSTQLLVWRGLSDGGFEEPALTVELGLVAEQFFVADLNGDNAPDLVATAFDARGVVVFLADP